MKAFIALLLVAFVTAAAWDTRETVSTLSCRTNSDTAGPVIQKIKAVVTGYDSTKLAGAGLLPAQATDVVLVTADSVCALAVAAFNTARPTAAPYSAPTAVYVVQAGSQRYIVFDPDYTSGEFIDLLIFNTVFSYMGWLAGA